MDLLNLLNNVKVIFLALLLAMWIPAQAQGDLDRKMDSLKAETVLMVSSQAIDEFPLWSPDGSYIACNIEGVWHKYDLQSLDISKVSWHSQYIGLVKFKALGQTLNADEINEFEKATLKDPRTIQTSNGIKIELKQYNFVVSMIVKYKSHEAIVKWRSDGENCHSLSLSPNQKYVAYLCEMTGLFVMRIQ